jgi:hypothetical protein
MAVPTTRQQFKDYCLRKLGAPVIILELDDDQVEDRIDEALLYYRDFHYNGAEKIYLKHQVIQTDIDNGYLTIGDPSVFAISNMFSMGGVIGSFSSNMFSMNYQIAMNEVWNLSSFSLIPYFLAREQIALIQEMLVGKQPIRFNQLTNQIHVDMAWSNIVVGHYLIFEGYKSIDPNTYNAIWGDRWLQNYTTVLIKEQWGGNITKYANAQVISGMTFNAARILDDAQKERKKLEDEMIFTWSEPVSDFYG